MAHQHGSQPVHVDNHSIIQPCQSFDLPNGDTVRASNFIICGAEPSSPQQSIARVLEMLHIASGAGSYVYILVRLYAVSGFVAPYRCPAISPKSPEVIRLIEARVSRCIEIGHSCKAP